MAVQPSEPPVKKALSNIGASALSIVSVVTGVLAYLLLPLYKLLHLKPLMAVFLAPISAIIAIVTGHRAFYEIKNGDHPLGGKKIPRIGLILGYVYFALTILLIVLAVIFFKDIVNGINQLLSNFGL
jgi:hypothetical protein